MLPYRGNYDISPWTVVTKGVLAVVSVVDTGCRALRLVSMSVCCDVEAVASVDCWCHDWISDALVGLWFSVTCSSGRQGKGGGGRKHVICAVLCDALLLHGMYYIMQAGEKGGCFIRSCLKYKSLTRFPCASGCCCDAHDM